MSAHSRQSIIVLAKAPTPGRVKTRLCPPLTPWQAATLAEAALADTLDVSIRSGVARVVLALDGDVPVWLPHPVQVMPQRGAGLAERIACAFEDAGGPALLIGMDTPQATPQLLALAIDELASPGVDAVLGGARDGGWWAAGLKRPNRDAFIGVPMSTRRTGAAQARRFRALRLRTVRLPVLRDVDRIDDVYEVSAEAPETRFAAAVSRLDVKRRAG